MATTGAIELIPQEIEAVKARTALTRRVQLITILIFLVVAGASGALFFFKQSLNSNLSDLEAQAATQEADIAEFADIETKVVGLQSRVALISQIFTTRDNFSKIFSAEEASRPSSLTLIGMTMKKDEATAAFDGNTPDYNTLSAYLNNLVDSQKGGVLFTQAALTSVTLDSATGNINFAVEVTIKAGGLKSSMPGGQQ